MNDETRLHYTKCALSLARRYTEATDERWQDDPMAFIDWCATLRPKLTKNTWRKYRAALTDFMRTRGPVEAVERLECLSTSPCKKSSPRRGKLEARALEKTVEYLLSRGDKYDRLCVSMLFAGRATGLRPRAEWPRARLVEEGDERYLIVKNAKHDERRGNGEYRTIYLSDEMPAAELDAIREVIAVAGSANPQRWAQIYRTVRKRLYDARPKGSDITLYNARHQFSANAKAGGLTKSEVAALMGHASADTASRHYGRRSSANGPVSVRPADDEVKTVRAARGGQTIHEKSATKGTSWSGTEHLRPDQWG